MDVFSFTIVSYSSSLFLNPYTQLTMNHLSKILAKYQIHDTISRCCMGGSQLLDAFQSSRQIKAKELFNKRKLQSKQTASLFPKIITSVYMQLSTGQVQSGPTAYCCYTLLKNGLSWLTHTLLPGCHPTPAYSDRYNLFPGQMPDWIPFSQFYYDFYISVLLYQLADITK